MPRLARLSEQEPQKQRGQGSRQQPHNGAQQYLG